MLVRVAVIESMINQSIGVSVSCKVIDIKNYKHGVICLAALLLWIPRGRIIWMQRSMTLSEFDSSGMAVLGI